MQFEKRWTTLYNKLSQNTPNDQLVIKDIWYKISGSNAYLYAVNMLWLHNNIKGRWAIGNLGDVWFEDEADAVLYKMVWE